MCLSSLSFLASQPTLHVRNSPSFDCLAAHPLPQLSLGFRALSPPLLKHLEASNNTVEAHAAVVATTIYQRLARRKAVSAEGRPSWRARRSTLSPSIRTTAVLLLVCYLYMLLPLRCKGLSFPCRVTLLPTACRHLERLPNLPHRSILSHL